jgi:amino acid permease
MRSSFLSSLAILIAATVGAGIFSLPFVFQKAGFLASTVLLLVLGAVIAATYSLYWDALEREENDANIFSLLQKYFGLVGTAFGLTVMISELMLVLGVLLMVGARFTNLLLPVVSSDVSLLLFWAAGSFFLLKKLKESLRLEVFAISSVGLIILFLSVVGLTRGAPSEFHWNVVNPLIAFGPILFALSGWTAVEPIRDMVKKSRAAQHIKKLFFLGVGIVCAMYFLFAVSILRVSSPVTPDTLSGVVSMGPWISLLLSLLGTVAILAGYLPLSLETRRLLSTAFTMTRQRANLFIIIFPLLLVLATKGDFIKILGFTGGIFISLQYVLILAVSHAACRFRGAKFFLWLLSLAVFSLAIVGEAYYLIVG